MNKLHVWVPLLPPSSNNIYIRHPSGKGRVLSEQARQFKIRAMQAIQEGGRVALTQFKANIPYELELAIFFDRVENKTSQHGNRYTRIDLSNRVKLIEDTVAAAVGLDDCHNFREVLEKHCDPQHPGIYVTLGPIPEEEVGLTKEKFDELRRHQSHGVGGTGGATGNPVDASGDQTRRTSRPVRGTSRPRRFPTRPS